MIRGERARRRFTNGLIYVSLSVLAIIWVLPIAYLILQSFRAEPGAYTPYVLPQGYTLDNYRLLFTDTSLFPYPLPI